jgi:hypothetical protein
MTVFRVSAETMLAEEFGPTEIVDQPESNEGRVLKVFVPVPEIAKGIWAFALKTRQASQTTENRRISIIGRHAASLTANLIPGSVAIVPKMG